MESAGGEDHLTAARDVAPAVAGEGIDKLHAGRAISRAVAGAERERESIYFDGFHGSSRACRRGIPSIAVDRNKPGVGADTAQHETRHGLLGGDVEVGPVACRVEVGRPGVGARLVSGRHAGGEEGGAGVGAVVGVAQDGQAQLGAARKEEP